MPNRPDKKRIFFVPGKNPKPPAAVHRRELWRCLLEGVRRAAPEAAREMSQHAESFALIPWNHLYYGRDKSLDPDLPWINRVIRHQTPSARDKREARSPRRRFARLLYHIGDLFPWLIDLIPDPAVKATIKETERYFNNTDNIAEEIREQLKAPLREAFAHKERVLVIGHSMGCIIAFDALWELWQRENIHERIETFLTIGCPLGMHYVRKRLLGAGAERAGRYPGNIRRWVNISARGDLVSLDVTLHDDYADMLKAKLVDTIEDHYEDVYNNFRNRQGLNVHRSYGYLVNPVVGAAIANWWSTDAASAASPARHTTHRGHRAHKSP